MLPLDKLLRLAQQHYTNRDYGSAVGFFLMLAKLDQAELSDWCLDHVLICLEHVTSSLEAAEHHNQLLKLFESCVSVFPHCAQLQHALGAYLYRREHWMVAGGWLHKALLTNSRTCSQQHRLETRAELEAREQLDRVNCRLVDRWHFSMLNDCGRNSVYYEAIHAAVNKLSPEDIVLDVGTGSGILSMMAVRCGARAVFTCEQSSVMCDVAAACFTDNKLADKVRLIRRSSLDISVPSDIPSPVSLLITETFDCGLFGEHVLTMLRHAWRHLLRNSDNCDAAVARARVLPASASIFTCAVQCASLRRRFCSQAETDGHARVSCTPNEPYWSEKMSIIPGGFKKLTADVRVLNVDFNNVQEIESYITGLQWNCSLGCVEDGRVDALIAWFQLHFDNDTLISTAPLTDARDYQACWEQAVFPVLHTCHARQGGHLNVRVACVNHLRLSVEPQEDIMSGSSCFKISTGTNPTDQPPGSVSSDINSSITDCAVSPDVASSGECVQVSAHITAPTSSCTSLSNVQLVDSREELVAYLNDTLFARWLRQSVLDWRNDILNDQYPPSRCVRVLSLMRCEGSCEQQDTACCWWRSLLPPNCRVSQLKHLLDESEASQCSPARDNCSRWDQLNTPCNSAQNGSSEEAFHAASSTHWSRVEREVSSVKWDLVLNYPLSCSGLLDPLVCRLLSRCSLNVGGVMLPRCLSVMAVLVQSSLLSNMFCVSSKNTLQFDCSAINMFQVEMLQNVTLDSEDQQRISAECHLASVDLSSGTIHPAQSLHSTSSRASQGVVSFTITLAMDQLGVRTQQHNTDASLLFWMKPLTADKENSNSGASCHYQGTRCAAVRCSLSAGDVRGQIALVCDSVRVHITA